MYDETSSYGSYLAKQVRAGVRAGGVQEVLYEGVEGGKRDYSDVVLKIKQLKPDVVYWAGYVGEAAIIIRQMRDEGIEAPLMSGDALASAEFGETVGADAEGTFMTFEPDPGKKGRG